MTCAVPRSARAAAAPAMAAEHAVPPALPLPLPLPPLVPAAPTSSRPDRDSLAAPSPPVLAGPVAALPQAVPAPHHHRDYDPALDPAIKQLLDQQAEIQARLAALLPQRYGPNIRLELDMLRHKLRVLRAYADDHREQPFDPLLCPPLRISSDHPV